MTGMNHTRRRRHQHCDGVNIFMAVVIKDHQICIERQSQARCIPVITGNSHFVKIEENLTM